MALEKTSLSAGSIIYHLLTTDREVMERARKVFPVVVDEARLPYVAYRRAALEANPAKGQGADTVTIEVRCYAAAYAESVELAEAVRRALDYRQADKDGLRMRSCLLVGASEGWEDDAYIQQLTFNIKM